MLTPERITQLPEASEIGESDYMLIDSPTLGTRKILASTFVPPEPQHNYLYKWDFTKEVDPLVDEINGQKVVDIYNVTQDNNGLYFDSASSYATIPYRLNAGQIADFQIGNINTAGKTGHGRFFMADADSGLIARSGTSASDGNRCLSVYTANNQWTSNSNISLNMFEDSILSIAIIENSSRYDWEIYKDGILLHTFSNAGQLIYADRFYIGSNAGQSFCNIYIKSLGIRNYENEEA